ncbi:nicotinamidase-related amidase [Silvimonas terrae]|uniref:Nicotinamidase-related amidase n=1 Tax=Silvimonas terrae TaxID=300266 RepID=A0A840RKN6_9NEIS|nr:isochorismatase family protein [Silvimonas terrae]MBB5193088.1 nicotinamidase-related amidase [Silvimonas terrae]
MKSALIVIDVQKSFTQQPFWSEEDLPAFREKQLALISGYKARGLPVVQIFHHSKGAFDPANGLCVSLDWLPDYADVSFNKHVHNALTDSGLLQWLHDNEIEHVSVSGIRTEQCCETTARVASDLGFKVDFVSEATLTWAMTHPDGSTLSAAEIKHRTELVLAGRFARIATVAQSLAGLDERTAT